MPSQHYNNNYYNTHSPYIPVYYRTEEAIGKAKSRMFLEPAKIMTVDSLEGLICTHEASFFKRNVFHNSCIRVLRLPFHLEWNTNPSNQSPWPQQRYMYMQIAHRCNPTSFPLVGVSICPGCISARGHPLYRQQPVSVSLSSHFSRQNGSG